MTNGPSKSPPSKGGFGGISILVPRLCLGTRRPAGHYPEIALFRYGTGGRASKSGIPRQSPGTRIRKSSTVYSSGAMR
jgi:hypothetical protein